MESSQGKLPSLREVVVLLIAGLPLVVTASAIEAADWVKGLPSLTALVLVSLLIWALLARSRAPWWVGHPVAVLASVLLAFVLGAVSLSDTNGLSDLLSEIGGWFGAIGSVGGNRGASITGVFLIGLTLLMSHATVWMVYRRSFALLAALPGLGVLLVILTFLPSDYYWYFFLYVLAAAPGVALRHEGQWKLKSLWVPLAGAILVAPVLMAAAVVPAWRSPAPEGIVIPLADQFEGPLYTFQSTWSNLFQGVPDRKKWPFYSPPHELPLGGPIEPLKMLPFSVLDDPPKQDTLFLVESEDPYRWRMRVYDTYTITGWSGDDEPIELASTEAPLEEDIDYLHQKRVEIGVRIFSKTNTLVSVGEPVEVRDVLTDVELTSQPSFKLYLNGGQRDYIPSDLLAFRQEILNWLSDPEALASTATRAPGDSTGSRRQLMDEPRFLPPVQGLADLGVQRVLGDASGEETAQNIIPLRSSYIEVERSEADPNQPMALVTQRVLNPPRQYRTVGLVSDATEQERRVAGQDYPKWITDRYLQLPPDFPETVRALAEMETANADNPHDKARAIQNYLRTIEYSLQVTLPPPGQDYVEFFLFNEPRRGFCQNYATAMITMLRSLGIPARLVVGFAPGVWDGSRGLWDVQSRHYHAWPEVYFPSLGWVEYEPTPAGVQDALTELGVTSGGLGGNAAVDDCVPDGGDVFGIDCGDESSLGDDPDLEDLLGDLDEGLDSSDASAVTGSGGLSTALFFVVIGIALAILLPAGLFGYSRWSLSRIPYVVTVYASMSAWGRLAGVGRRPNDTPWEYVGRLREELPEHGEDINQIASRYVSSRYGNPAARQRSYAEDMWGLRAAWARVRRALLGRALRRLAPRRQVDWL